MIALVLNQQVVFNGLVRGLVGLGLGGDAGGGQTLLADGLALGVADLLLGGGEIGAALGVDPLGALDVEARGVFLTFRLLDVVHGRAPERVVRVAEAGVRAREIGRAAGAGRTGPPWSAPAAVRGRR